MTRILLIILLLNCYYWGLAQNTATVIESEELTGGELVRPDQLGNLYVSGYFSGELKFGQQTFKADEGRYFLIKYNQASPRQILWAKQLNIPIKDLTITKSGIYILGQHQEGVHLSETVTLEAKGYFSTFIAHYKHNGELAWAKSLNADYEVLARRLINDKQGDLIVMGTFSGKFNVDGKVLTPHKRQNLYLLKLSPEGKLRWAQTASGGENMITGIYAWGLSVDPKGQICIAGSLIGTAYFGKQIVTSSRHYFAGEGWVNDSDIFLAKYRPSGELIWAKNVASRAEPESIATDQNGSIYITGYFRGSENPRQPKLLGIAQFGDNQQLKTTFKGKDPSEDLFLAKYSPLGNLIWVKQGKGKAVSRGISIGVDVSKELVYVAGFFTECLDLEGVEICTEGRPAHKGDIYLACFQANGKFLWLKQGGGKESDDVSDLSLGSEGQVYITGRFRRSANFGSLKLFSQSPKGSNAYIVRY